VRWKDRRQSSNVKKLSKDDIANVISADDYKDQLLRAQTKKAKESSGLRSKNLKKQKDLGTSVMNKFNNTKDEQKNNARRLIQLKDTAKPKHLIPASKKQARVR
jgi:endo-alpha-1,4-polygalactosaminidase (GH114 family)